MVLVLPSFLLHDLTYPLAQTWREMLVSKEGKATTGTFLGLNLFPLRVPPEQPHCTFKEHQQLSPLSAIHHEFTLHSNSCKNKMESSAAVRNKGFFPCSCWDHHVAKMELPCAKLSASVKTYEQTSCCQKENRGKSEKPPWFVCNKEAGSIGQVQTQPRMDWSRWQIPVCLKISGSVAVCTHEEEAPSSWPASWHGHIR